MNQRSVIDEPNRSDVVRALEWTELEVSADGAASEFWLSAAAYSAISKLSLDPAARENQSVEGRPHGASTGTLGRVDAERLDDPVGVGASGHVPAAGSAAPLTSIHLPIFANPRRDPKKGKNPGKKCCVKEFKYPSSKRLYSEEVPDSDGKRFWLGVAFEAEAEFREDKKAGEDGLRCVCECCEFRQSVGGSAEQSAGGGSRTHMARGLALETADDGAIGELGGKSAADAIPIEASELARAHMSVRNAKSQAELISAIFATKLAKKMTHYLYRGYGRRANLDVMTSEGNQEAQARFAAREKRGFVDSYYKDLRAGRPALVQGWGGVDGYFDTRKALDAWAEQRRRSNRLDPETGREVLAEVTSKHSVSGCHYWMKDEVAVLLEVGQKMSFEYKFKGEIVDVCRGGVVRTESFTLSATGSLQSAGKPKVSGELAGKPIK